jgi:hypothetical protein
MSLLFAHAFKFFSPNHPAILWCAINAIGKEVLNQETAFVSFYVVVC